MEEIKPIPESISHKSLDSLFVKAQKELTSFKGNENNYSKEKNGLQDLLNNWQTISQEVITKLSNHKSNISDNRSPKSLMALGAMEVHINMAIQALKASEIEE